MNNNSLNWIAERIQRVGRGAAFGSRDPGKRGRSPNPKGSKRLAPGRARNERTSGVYDTHAIHPGGVAAPWLVTELFQNLEGFVMAKRATTPFGVFRYGYEFPGCRSFLAQPRANGFEPFGFSLPATTFTTDLASARCGQFLACDKSPHSTRRRGAALFPICEVQDDESTGTAPPYPSKS